jgi:chemotaxis protein MotB
VEAPPEKKAPAGAPAWMLTFADLMSLLLAFFVLMFSFSEMDKQKFKELSGSLKDAFGVQKEIKAKDTPIGTSIIAREFSPGRVSSTPDNVVRQDSTSNLQRYALAQDIELAKSILEVEINQDQVDVVASEEGFLVIRIREHASFASGSAGLDNRFDKIGKKISTVINSIPGEIIIAGHTDNVPIHTDSYRSNWDLSSARAVSMLHSLMDLSGADASRFRAVGYAAFHPLYPNDSEEHRARNRRVEIQISRRVDM